jgi:hypothetical protein
LRQTSHPFGPHNTSGGDPGGYMSGRGFLVLLIPNYEVCVLILAIHKALGKSNSTELIERIFESNSILFKIGGVFLWIR